MSAETILQQIDKVLAVQDSRQPGYHAPEDESASIFIPHGWLSYADLRSIKAAMLAHRAPAPVSEDVSRTDADIIDAIYLNVCNHMSGGGCPTPGCLGECAIIAPMCEAHDGSGRTVWSAACYMWDTQFNDSALLASWFQEKGAKGVTVSHVLFDEDNGDRDGKAGDMDDVRAWHVHFVLERATSPEVGR